MTVNPTIPIFLLIQVWSFLYIQYYINSVLFQKQAANRNRKNGKKPKRETVQVITKDLIRNLM